MRGFLIGAGISIFSVGMFFLSSLFVLLWGKESGFTALDDLEVTAMLLPRPSRR